MKNYNNLLIFPTFVRDDNSRKDQLPGKAVEDSVVRDKWTSDWENFSSDDDRNHTTGTFDIEDVYWRRRWMQI
jgi:hypothetical protein